MLKIYWKLPAEESITSKTADIANRRMNFQRACPSLKNIYISDVVVPVWVSLILFMDIIFGHNFIQSTYTSSKSIIETLEQKILKLVQDEQWRHQNDVKWRRSGAFVAEFKQVNTSWVPWRHLSDQS